MSTPLITCSHVTMAYDKNVILQDINFTLDVGDYLCVIGQNGSGKSTLIKGLLGLLKPTGGTIQYHNLKSSQIGYLPQRAVIQKDFPASVYEVVLSGCLNSTGLLPFYSAAAKKRAAHEIDHVGLHGLEKRRFHELSGGQQQRVLLARALCATTKLLLLDEPVAGLDPEATSDMYALIAQMKKEHNVTVLMISHDLKSALQYGNKILQLQNQKAFIVTPQEYLQTDAGRKLQQEV